MGRLDLVSRCGAARKYLNVFFLKMIIKKAFYSFGCNSGVAFGRFVCGIQCVVSGLDAIITQNECFGFGGSVINIPQTILHLIVWHRLSRQIFRSYSNINFVP